MRENIKKDHKNNVREKLCPAAKKCGGCQWINIPYKQQLDNKEKWIGERMKPFCKMEPIVGMKDPKYYRNRVHAVFGEDSRHNPISGKYQEGTHRIIPVDSCLIDNRKADEMIASIRNLLKSFKIKPYNEDTGYGLLRHVLVRMSHAAKEVMVVLVLRSSILPSKNNFAKALLKQHPEITTIVVNVNDRSKGMVLGDKEQVIYGKGYIEDVLCEKVFRISSKSFYPVNPVQAEKLYYKAVEMAGLSGKEIVVDAYCGIGILGIAASDRAGQVIGIESNGDAVRDAKNNAKRNGIGNIQFYKGDAGEFLMEMAGQQAKVDVVFVEPPRAGSNEAFLGAVGALKPEKVVYVSGNPEALVKDIKYLMKKGYQVMKGKSYDLQPFNRYVECCVLMSRIKG